MPAGSCPDRASASSKTFVTMRSTSFACSSTIVGGRGARRAAAPRRAHARARRLRGSSSSRVTVSQCALRRRESPGIRTPPRRSRGGVNTSLASRLTSSASVVSSSRPRERLPSCGERACASQASSRAALRFAGLRFAALRFGGLTLRSLALRGLTLRSLALARAYASQPCASRAYASQPCASRGLALRSLASRRLTRGLLARRCLTLRSLPASSASGSPPFIGQMTSSSLQTRVYAYPCKEVRKNHSGKLRACEGFSRNVVKRRSIAQRLTIC